MAGSYIEAFTKASQKNPGSSFSICSVSTSSTLARRGEREEFRYLEETSTGEFAFIQVTSDDSTVCHDVPIASSVSTSDDEAHLPRGPVNALSKPAKEERQPAPLQHAATFHISSSPEKLQVTVKNTFIHGIGDELEPTDMENPHWSSCPAVFMTGEHHTIYPLMEDTHIKGDCRPCAYFLTKTDGCRAGGQCNFCHLCPLGAIKKKKKEKVKLLRERDRLLKLAAS